VEPFELSLAIRTLPAKKAVTIKRETQGNP
jgi:hypothetical protein